MGKKNKYKDPKVLEEAKKNRQRAKKVRKYVRVNKQKLWVDVNKK